MEAKKNNKLKKQLKRENLRKICEEILSERKRQGRKNKEKKTCIGKLPQKSFRI